MKKSILLVCALLSTHLLSAQESTQSVMESSGKIFVVLATVLVIYAGFMIFLTVIDRRISNLERQIKD